MGIKFKYKDSNKEGFLTDKIIYTGVKDINGNEIYDMDKVRFDLDEINYEGMDYPVVTHGEGTVRFVEGTFMIEYMGSLVAELNSINFELVEKNGK